MGGPSRRFLCLFWRETRQRIFGPEISPYPEVVRGHEKRVEGKRSWEAVGDGIAERRVSRRVGVEPRTDAVDSGDSSREVRVQRRRLSQDVGIPVACRVPLVTHASVSPHMHVVLHILLLLLVNPKHCSFCSFVLLFSPDPSIVFL